MDVEWISKLSEQQKQCLRLVSQGLKTKDMCRRLNLEPNTIDNYIHRAASLFGVNNRYDAARIFVELESLAANGESLSRSQDVDIGPQSGPSSETGMVPERQQSIASIVMAFLALPPIGGPDNALDVHRKFLLALRVSILFGTGSAFLIGVAYWLMRLSG